MEANLTEAELNFWFKYSRKRMLPHRRFEYYLAQIASQISILGTAYGGKAYPVKDFLFDEPDKIKNKKDTTESASQAIGALVGGVKVVRLGQKKKAKGNIHG